MTVRTGLAKYGQFIFTLDDNPVPSPATPATLLESVSCQVTLKNKLITGERGGVNGVNRAYSHDDMDISIGSPISLTSTSNLSLLGDVIMTLGSETVTLHKSANVSFTQKVVEAEVNGLNYPCREYGRQDMSISIDGNAQITQSGTATPTIDVINAYHNTIADAIENHTEITCTITTPLFDISTGQFLVEEIGQDAKDNDFTGTSYKLVPNGFPTVTANSDAAMPWISRLVTMFLTQAKLTGTVVTSTYTASGVFIVESCEDKSDDGKFGDASFKLLPDGDLTFTPFVTTPA